MAQTITEKILSRACGRSVQADELVNVRVDALMMHDYFAPIAYKQFEKLGVEKIWDNNKVIHVLDHLSVGHTVKDAEHLKLNRDFAHKYKLKNFFHIGKNGVCHQIMVEKGFVLPGTVSVGTDSHATTYGALGAFSCGVSTTEAAVIMATGEIWFRVPKTIRINIVGKVPVGITGKDIVIKILGLKDWGGEPFYKAVEIGGEAIQELEMADRFTICNMLAELGVKNGIIEPDGKTVSYLKERTSQPYEIILSDEDAPYEQVYTVDISNLSPQLSCPHSMDNIADVSEVMGKKIDEAYLGSCTNGRLEDLEIAAKILKDKKIASHVRMIVVPASRKIYLDAMQKGYIETFVKAGAIVEGPSCGACAGFHTGLLAAGEVAISTTNRNFKGRMGSTDSEVYLASPATVAASAVEGVIADPRKYLK